MASATLYRGQPALKLSQWVGVIRTPDGTVLEILPKTHRRGDDPRASRALLLKMLAATETTASTEGQRTVKASEAPVDKAKTISKAAASRSSTQARAEDGTASRGSAGVVIDAPGRGVECVSGWWRVASDTGDHLEADHAGDDREDEIIFRWANELARADAIASVFTVSVGKRNTEACATLTQGTTGLLSVLGRLAKISGESAPVDYFNNKSKA